MFQLYCSFTCLHLVIMYIDQDTVQSIISYMKVLCMDRFLFQRPNTLTTVEKPFRITSSS